MHDDITKPTRDIVIERPVEKKVIRVEYYLYMSIVVQRILNLYLFRLYTTIKSATNPGRSHYTANTRIV